nr:MAG TPA: hypothetical protein [Bacteriophage sp.]
MSLNLKILPALILLISLIPFSFASCSTVIPLAYAILLRVSPRLI